MHKRQNIIKIDILSYIERKPNNMSRENKKKVKRDAMKINLKKIMRRVHEK